VWSSFENGQVLHIARTADENRVHWLLLVLVTEIAGARGLSSQLRWVALSQTEN
jgi:hypothetical protein